MCKTNTSNSDNRTSIPVYSQVTQREHKSGDKLIKNNSKFVEINDNEWLIFVRKSTLLWLIQEVERVSADRLFRVCAKQPFSTPIQPIRPQSDFSVPQVREFVEILGLDTGQVWKHCFTVNLKSPHIRMFFLSLEYYDNRGCPI